jgi:hypothetical protein
VLQLTKSGCKLTKEVNHIEASAAPMGHLHRKVLLR